MVYQVDLLLYIITFQDFLPILYFVSPMNLYHGVHLGSIRWIYFYITSLFQDFLPVLYFISSMNRYHGVHLESIRWIHFYITSLFQDFLPVLFFHIIYESISWCSFSLSGGFTSVLTFFFSRFLTCIVFHISYKSSPLISCTWPVFLLQTYVMPFINKVHCANKLQRFFSNMSLIAYLSWAH